MESDAGQDEAATRFNDRMKKTFKPEHVASAGPAVASHGQRSSVLPLSHQNLAHGLANGAYPSSQILQQPKGGKENDQMILASDWSANGVHLGQGTEKHSGQVGRSWPNHYAQQQADSPLHQSKVFRPRYALTSYHHPQHHHSHQVPQGAVTSTNPYLQSSTAGSPRFGGRNTDELHQQQPSMEQSNHEAETRPERVGMKPAYCAKQDRRWERIEELRIQYTSESQFLVQRLEELQQRLFPEDSVADFKRKQEAKISRKITQRDRSAAGSQRTQNPSKLQRKERHDLAKQEGRLKKWKDKIDRDNAWVDEGGAGQEQGGKAALLSRLGYHRGTDLKAWVWKEDN